MPSFFTNFPKPYTHLFTVQLNKQSVGYKFYVLLHKIPIHSDQITWQSFGEEFLFNYHSILDNSMDLLLAGFVLQMTEHKAGKITVEALVKQNLNTN